MVRGGAMLWPLRIGLIALCAVVPWLAGPWYAIALLLALPVLRAPLDAMQEHWVARMCILGACARAALLEPAWLWPAAAVWGAGLLVMSLQRVSPGTPTLRAGAVLAAVTAMVALALASGRSDQPLIPWLAEAIADRIDRSPDSVSILLRAYQSGLARLEGTMSLMPAVQSFFRIPGLPEEVRLQLLYSLRASLETLFKVYLPRGLMTWALLTALLPTVATELCLRSRGRRSDLPPLEKWFIPRHLSRGVTALLLMGLLPYLTASATLGYLGTMCNTLALGAIGLQGASAVLDWLLGRHFQPVTCGLIIALGALMLPTVLFFFGIYDQFFDPRQLRGSHDETN